MPKKNEQNELNERLIDAIEKLSFLIDSAKNQNNDYSQHFMDIFVSLKEIGKGYTNDGCLYKIHHELRLLNKTLIMAALLISATKTPEQTLQEYHKIIKQYLD